ncbi:GDSL lipase/esterase, partial [Dillenia turbinata]
QGQGLCPFEAIYQFGDSISDTGNIGFINPMGPCSNLPYGKTQFGKGVGRCSDGLLMIDYITQALQHPLLPPYLQNSTETNHGVNFAVAGSTDLDTDFFKERNVTWKNSQNDRPIHDQLNWFREHLNNSVCKTLMPTECARKLSKALFILGEIGFNDFNWPLKSGKTVTEMTSYIQPIVQKTTDAVRELIRQGAVRIVVPGLFPMGCFPLYLNHKGPNAVTLKDASGCLGPFNQLAKDYNKALQDALSLLGKENPNVFILYGDYYTAYESLLRNAPGLGEFPIQRFDDPLKSCAGNCTNPSKYLIFDHVHPTQEAAKHLAAYVIKETLSKIPCAQ